MDFGQLCADVMTATGRPDLIADIQLAVRTATLKFHMKDFWKRDLVEKSFPFTSSGMTFQIDISSSLERWRKFSYIQPLDVDGLTPINLYLKEVDPSNIFDEFQARKVDVFYVAGTNLNIRTKSSYNGFIMAWYQYPLVMPNNFSSWIAEIYPYIIIEEATGKILNIIGQVEEANKFLDPVKGTIYGPHGHYSVLMTNELEATAR